MFYIDLPRFSVSDTFDTFDTFEKVSQNFPLFSFMFLRYICDTFAIHYQKKKKGFSFFFFFLFLNLLNYLLCFDNFFYIVIP